MPSRPTPPYSAPPADSVNAGVWLLGDSEEPLGPRLEDWDYATELALGRSLAMDVDEVRRQARLPTDARLSIVITAESTSTGIRRVVHREHVTQPVIQLSFTIPATEIGGVLTLATELVLQSAVPASLLGPHRAGSVLWSDRQRVSLEGDASRFPVEVLSFAEAGLPRKAPWVIEIHNDDLERPASSSTKLLINADHEAARTMASDPNGSTASRLLSDALECDIALRIFRTALASSELEDSAEYPEGSIGQALLGFLAVNLPHRDLPGLRAMGPSYVGIVEAELLSSLEVYQS